MLCSDVVRHDGHTQDVTATGSQVRAQEDGQTGMDHRTACQLLIPHQIALERDRVQQRDPREGAQKQGPGATWMELQSGQQNPRATCVELPSFPRGVTGAVSPPRKH